jgi:hypothetical protein
MLVFFVISFAILFLFLHDLLTPLLVIFLVKGCFASRFYNATNSALYSTHINWDISTVSRTRPVFLPLPHSPSPPKTVIFFLFAKQFYLAAENTDFIATERQERSSPTEMK